MSTGNIVNVATRGCVTFSQLILIVLSVAMDVYTITCFTAFLTFILGICSQTTDRPPPSVTSQFRATKLAVIGRYKAATLNGSISSVSAVAQNDSTSTRTLLPFEIEVSLREKPQTRSHARPKISQLVNYASSRRYQRSRQNCRHFTDDIFKRIFLNKNARISLKISLKFVPNAWINNIPALAQIMLWRRPGDKPLYDPVNLLTQIYVSRPQCVNRHSVSSIHDIVMVQWEKTLQSCWPILSYLFW